MVVPDRELAMFEVEAVDQGFLGKRARLRALGEAGDSGKNTFAANDDLWVKSLQRSFAAGDVVTVILPAYVKLQVGQTLTVPAI
jgi:hypothetical protein